MYEINSMACKIIEIFLKNPSIENHISKVNEGKIFFQKNY